jgi:hypothetical protein
MGLLLSWTSHLFISTHIFPTLIHSFFSSKQFYISFSDAPVVYRVPQRGERRQQLPCMDTVCVFVCYFPFYDMRQKGEKTFFYDSSQVQSTRTQKRRDLNAFLLSISGAFHAGYSRARSIHQVCARPSSLARYFSPSFIFLKGIPTEKRTVKENEKREREREGCVLPFQ